MAEDRKRLSVDATYQVISTGERDRLTALYRPLTEAVRDLIDATIRTNVDATTISDACTAIGR